MINLKNITERKVEIVGASKTRSISEIRNLYETGHISAFGENRVQEFLEKYDSAFTWDFIGQLQTNKVKYIIDKVRLIHSVDRESLLKEIDLRAGKIGKVQKILIEINSGNEESKGGISVKDGEAFAKTVEGYKNISLAGVMAVAPLDISKEELKTLFMPVHELFIKLKSQYPTVKYLSMGMSSDYEVAIECGSNMVRLGTVLFGDRD
ncbi:MAG: YggS family pyridoxal phosphate-dependent enzyme [Firmicutes bacterium]|nr:YggS family pyridoxal phosphate-dependent enzyme [Bacillota bacterium]